MDIALFISELLAQQGTLVVPGFGTFSRNRVEGYYSKDQQQFYPPTLQIQFKTEFTDDNVLANLIATERQISVASAKYFIEKFVTTIKDQASAGTVAFGHMGTFSTRRSGLTFTSAELNETDELFYGLAPVKLKRNNSFKQQAPPVTVPNVVEPAPAPAVEPVTVPDPIIIAEEPEEVEADQEEYQEEYVIAGEERPRRKMNIWLILALIIVLAGLSIIGVYFYKPALLNRLKPFLRKFKHAQPLPVRLSEADSLKQTQQAQKDIGILPSAPVVKADTTPVDTFRIVVDQFKTLKVARKDSASRAKQNFTVEIHKNPSNRRYQVSIGNYLNADSARAALPMLKQKLKKKDITIQTYPFKKP
jgi:hypothetical protein